MVALEEVRDSYISFKSHNMEVATDVGDELSSQQFLLELT